MHIHEQTGMHLRLHIHFTYIDNIMAINLIQFNRSIEMSNYLWLSGIYCLIEF